MKNKIITIAGIFLLVFGAAVLLYPDFKTWEIEKRSEKIVSYFESARVESNGRNTEKTDSVSEAYQKDNTVLYPELYEEMLLFNKRLYEEGDSFSKELRYEDSPVDTGSLFLGESLIGCIEIPSIKCVLPLYIGADEYNLSLGAAVMGNASMPIGGINTNCVIAAHRGYKGSAYFRNINSIAEGDLIYITNPWETLIYKAVFAYVADPWDDSITLITSGKDMATLISCHPYMLGGGPKRYIVLCERTYDASSFDNIYYSSSAENADKKNDYNFADNIEEEPLIIFEDALRIACSALLIIAAVIIIIKRIKTAAKKDRI